MTSTFIVCPSWTVWPRKHKYFLYPKHYKLWAFGRFWKNCVINELRNEHLRLSNEYNR